MRDPIRVLVVDDSALMRQMITRFLTEAGMEIIGTAKDGLEGFALARMLRPDVMTLDIEMPKMDGLEVLRRLMDEAPLPVVMVSTLTQKNAAATVEALSLGAVDVVGKPGGGISLSLHEIRDELVEKVRLAARARLTMRRDTSSIRRTATARQGTRQIADGIVVIGSSTGGPRALNEVLPRLPADFPLPIIIVQHMPMGFTASLAKRLDNLCALSVQEATEGKVPRAGEVWMAQGGYHLIFSDRGEMQLDGGPTHLGVRPAVDITVDSAVDFWGAGVLLTVLTGMGTDGMRGAQRVKKAGGTVLAQNEESCVVYGMPRAVIEKGYADQVAHLNDIAKVLVDWVDQPA